MGDTEHGTWGSRELGHYIERRKEHQAMSAKTKAQHTPGPWKADIYGAHPEDAIGGQIDGPNGEHIADLPNHGPDSGITPQQFEANARLIAAAPELLEAASKVLATFPAAYVAQNPDLLRLESAIRQAKGDKQ